MPLKALIKPPGQFFTQPITSNSMRSTKPVIFMFLSPIPFADHKFMIPQFAHHFGLLKSPKILRDFKALKARK